MVVLNLKGTPGPKGEPGTAGTNGTNGTNGSNGTNGPYNARVSANATAADHYFNISGNGGAVNPSAFSETAPVSMIYLQANHTYKFRVQFGSGTVAPATVVKVNLFKITGTAGNLYTLGAAITLAEDNMTAINTLTETIVEFTPTAEQAGWYLFSYHPTEAAASGSSASIQINVS